MTNPNPLNPRDDLPLLSFDSIEAFYSDREERRYSGEADFGTLWRLRGWPGMFRVSYVQATGDVYAYHHLTGTVIVLGVVPPDPVPQDSSRYGLTPGAGVYYRTLDQVLGGWAKHCGEANGLSWVIDRLASAQGEPCDSASGETA